MDFVKSKYSASSFHYIYNIIRMFGDISLQVSENACKEDDVFSLTNDQKEQYSHFLINLTFDAIKNDHDLSPEEKIELSKFVSRVFSTKRKTNFPKVVKSMERKVRHHCKKTIKIKQYDDFQCSTLFFPEAFESHGYKRKLMNT